MASLWSGVFPAFTTPFRKDLSIDFDALGRHLELMLSNEIHGVVMLGSLGENVSLSTQEKEQVIRFTLDTVAGRVPVLSGVAELCTQAAVRYIADAKSWGVQGVMVMPSMAFRPDPAETVAHYTTIAGSTDLPMMVYNNPLSYHADMLPEMYEPLSKFDHVVAIKESNGDTRRTTDILTRWGDRFTLFAGVDDLALECCVLGAKGWVAGIGLAFPKENARLWSLMMQGRWDEALPLYRWFTPLMHLDVGPKFVQKIKLALHHEGIHEEWVRLPRLPLSSAERESTLRIISSAVEQRPC